MEAIETKTLELAGTTYRISIYPDQDAENPCKWEGWRLVSFSRRHAAFADPDRYCKGLDRWCAPIPADIGIGRKLDCGTAFWLSYYEHGLCRWSLMGEGPQCRWDSVRVAGILLWESSPRELAADFPSREAEARQFLETYTAWANGEVYGYEIERLPPGNGPGSAAAESLESCWGIYGMAECLAEAEASLHRTITE